MYKYFSNSVNMAQKIMIDYVKEGDIVLDCTLGNGNDTLSLAKLVGKNGKVYGFDIQSIALKRTKEKLETKNLLDRVILIHDSHENIHKYIVDRPSFVIYNLGYLPGGDKKIVTNSTSTIKSLEKALKIMKSNGLLLITCYTGHSGGEGEKESVETYLKSLDQKDFNILKFTFINQKNNPPILYGVEKS